MELTVDIRINKMKNLEECCIDCVDIENKRLFNSLLIKDADLYSTYLFEPYTVWRKKFEEFFDCKVDWDPTNNSCPVLVFSSADHKLAFLIKWLPALRFDTVEEAYRASRLQGF